MSGLLDLANAVVTAATTLRNAIATQEQSAPAQNPPAEQPQQPPPVVVQPAPDTPTNATRIERGKRAFGYAQDRQPLGYVFNSGPGGRGGDITIGDDQGDRLIRSLQVEGGFAAVRDFQPTQVYIVADHPYQSYPTFPPNTDIYFQVTQEGNGHFCIDVR